MSGTFKRLLSLVVVLSFSVYAFSQNWVKTNVSGQKVLVQKAAYFDVSKPLTQMKPIEDWVYENEKEERRVVPNKFLFKFFSSVENTDDPVSQRFMAVPGLKAAANVSVNFDGIKNKDNVDGLVAPPDPQGDVSPDYIVEAVNNMTAIYDRNGNLVWGPQPTSVFWDGFDGPWTGTNDGDPIILWDEQAQRWLISQFAVSTSDGSQWELVAISTTSDPTGSYYRYAFQFDAMPDYPKLGVWPDGYYLSANAFSTTGRGSYLGTYAAALERDKMLQGDPDARMVLFFNDWSSTGTFTFLPSDADVFPPYGTPNYFVYDRDDDTYWSNEGLYVWAFHVDWTNTANSSFTQVSSLSPAPFNSSFTSGAPQAGTTQDLDLLNDRMMFRAYFRPFSDHNSIVVARTVNDGGVAAVRWYELRDDGNGWYIYQQGTYNPGDGKWRWMPSIAMNANGDIALGYSISSSDMYPGIRVTGRLAGDPLGVMTIDETVIFDGPAAQDGVDRWGDYAMMTVDPVDNTSFWFTTEYSEGSWYWATRIAKFDLGSTSSGGDDNTCVAPTITQQPQSQTVDEGATVTFSVTADGTDLLYQWRKDGQDIAGATSSSLTLTNVTVDDAGDYDVVVYNDCGSVTSNTATLTVNSTSTGGDEIVITQQPTGVSVRSGSDATFTIVAEGTNLQYQWYKDGTALVDGTYITGATTSTLTVEYCANSDEGYYWCVVYNDNASVESDHVFLNVFGRPVSKSAEEFEQAWVNAYPNPFVDKFTVNISDNNLPAQVVVRDITGKVLFSGTATKPYIGVDLKDVQGKMFVVEIKGPNGVQTIKVMRK